MSSSTQLIKQLIGSPSDFGVGWIIILISAIISIFIATVKLFKLLTKKRTDKNILLQKLSSLAIGTNIDYFKTSLGNPVFINEVAGHKEYIFVNASFYVQALMSPNDGRVVLFSVTTRKKRFNPILKIGHLSQFSITLGKTTFAELGCQPKRIVKRGGDHGGFDFYSELYYLGFDGHYLTYAFSVNENGCGRFTDIPDSFLRNVPEDPVAVKKFRSENIINTYTISSFEEKEIGQNLELGPRHNQVRVLQGSESTVY